MDKRGPKPRFIDVACPNKNCKLYGLTNQDNKVNDSMMKNMDELWVIIQKKSS